MQKTCFQIIDSCFQIHGYAFRVDTAGGYFSYDPGEYRIAECLQTQTLTELKKLHKDPVRLQTLVDQCTDELGRAYYIDAVRYRVWRFGNRRRTKRLRQFRKQIGQDLPF